MENLNKTMKLSIIYGFIGAAAIPFVYESYANISTTVALFIWFCWIIYTGVKFSSLGVKEAFIGITCDIAYSGILGFVCYLFIHPRIENMLWEKSVYFQLSLSEQIKFVLYIFLLSLCMYIIRIARLGFSKAAEKIKSNGEKARESIENAFEDEDK